MSTLKRLLEAVASADGPRDPQEDLAIERMERFCGRHGGETASGSLRELFRAVDPNLLRGRLPTALWYVCAADLDDRPFTESELTFLSPLKDLLDPYTPSELLPRLAYMGRWASDAIRDAATVLALPLCGEPSTVEACLDGSSASKRNVNDDGATGLSERELQRRTARIADSQATLREFLKHQLSAPLVVCGPKSGELVSVAAAGECRCPLCRRVQPLPREMAAVRLARCVGCRAMLAHDQSMLEDILRLRASVERIEDIDGVELGDDFARCHFDVREETEALLHRVRALPPLVPLRLEARASGDHAAPLASPDAKEFSPSIGGEVFRVMIVVAGIVSVVLGFMWFPAWASVGAWVLGVALIALPQMLREGEPKAVRRWLGIGRIPDEDQTQELQDRGEHFRSLAESVQSESFERCRRLAEEKRRVVAELEGVGERIRRVARGAPEQLEQTTSPTPVSMWRDRLSRYRVEQLGLTADLVEYLRSRGVRSAADVDPNTVRDLDVKKAREVSRHLLRWLDEVSKRERAAVAQDVAQSRAQRAVDTLMNTVTRRVVDLEVSYRDQLAEQHDRQKHLTRYLRLAERSEKHATPRREKWSPAERQAAEAWDEMDDISRIALWVRRRFR
jgi:hypothetical protein